MMYLGLLEQKYKKKLEEKIKVLISKYLSVLLGIKKLEI